jgi:hypothetical protein
MFRQGKYFEKQCRESMFGSALYCLVFSRDGGGVPVVDYVT